jgi:hypothetical protein
MTIVWFIVWLIANNIGDAEPLRFAPVNWWAGTLLLVIALDINRPERLPRRGK